MSNFGQVRAQRGRPKKKPEYCREREIQELVKKAVALYRIPYDDRIERPTEAPTLVAVADEMNTTTMRVRKLLITGGYFTTAISRKVQELAKTGNSLSQISEQTGLSVASVCGYLPYIKGAYNLEDPTLYAEQSRMLRKRRKACKELEEHPGDEQYLWQAIIAFENYPFQTDGKVFRYTVRGEKVCFTDVEFSREAFNKAYRTALKVQAAEGFVDSCERLGCIGAREIYTVFLRIGACHAKA